MNFATRLVTSTRLIVTVLVLLAGTAGAWAQSNATGHTDSATPWDSDAERPPLPAEAEFAALLGQNADTRVGDLTVADVARVLDLASIARQQREHVEASVRASWMLAGAGHLMNGDTGTAAALITTDILLRATTVVLAYLLLPPAVHQVNLNYLQSSFATIEDRWKSIAPAQLIPSLAVLATGTLADLTVRSFATRDARDTAVRAITDGTVTFELRPADEASGLLETRQ